MVLTGDDDDEDEDLYMKRETEQLKYKESRRGFQVSFTPSGKCREVRRPGAPEWPFSALEVW